MQPVVLAVCWLNCQAISQDVELGTTRIPDRRRPRNIGRAQFPIAVDGSEVRCDPDSMSIIHHNLLEAPLRQDGPWCIPIRRLSSPKSVQLAGPRIHKPERPKSRRLLLPLRCMRPTRESNHSVMKGRATFDRAPSCQNVAIHGERAQDLATSTGTSRSPVQSMVLAVCCWKCRTACRHVGLRTIRIPAGDGPRNNDRAQFRRGCSHFVLLGTRAAAVGRVDLFAARLIPDGRWRFPCSTFERSAISSSCRTFDFQTRLADVRDLGYCR